MAQRRPLRQIRAQRTRRRLLAAAKRVFAAKGYDGSTVDDLCEAARCSKGSYYFHFDSKEEALLTLLEAWTREQTEALRRSGRSWPDLPSALFSNGASWPPALVLEFWAHGSRNAKAGRILRAAADGWRRLLGQRFAVELARPDLADIAIVICSGMVLQAALGGGYSRSHDLTRALDELARSVPMRRTG